MNEIKCIELLKQAIEQVTVNTYVEQGQAGADEVFKILEQVESEIKENTHDSDGMSCTGKNCPLGFGEVKRCTVHNCEDRTKPKTNFDRITESVESLAEFLGKTMMCDDCPIRLQTNTCKCSVSIPCSTVIKEWLQKECEE